MESDKPGFVNGRPGAEREAHATLIIPQHATGQVDTRQWWQKLTRDILLDLAIMAILIAITASLEAAEPRKVFFVKETLWRHSYPFKENSVPSWVVPVYSFGAPLLAFTAHKLFVKASNRAMTWYDWYRVSLAMVNAVLLTASLTNCIKIAIGRPRPNFVFRCWADGNPIWQHGGNQYGGFAECTTPDNMDYEHRKSFPSGHSSWSAAGLGFFTFWLFGQTQAFSGYPHVWRISFSLVPAFAALVVGITRITDYWHHVSDVCFGLALGYFISFVFYNQLFPWFTNQDCCMPLTHGRYAGPAFRGGNGRRPSRDAPPSVS